MDTWLKALIATACVVVIALGAHYGWGEFRSYQRSNEVAASRERARNELFRLAKADKNDVNRVRDFCKAMSNRRYRHDDSSDYTYAIVRNCNSLGYN